MINNIKNNRKKSKVNEIYQVIQSNYPILDGYTPGEEQIMKTFVDLKKAERYRNRLENKIKIKKQALEEAGHSGWYNKFDNYQYYINTINVND